MSYTRFVEWKQEVLPLLRHDLSANIGECRGISFVDSTRLRVCDNKRIASHKVFAGEAARSKTSMGWFYGFKLPRIINEKGELLEVTLTAANREDRNWLWGLVPDGQFYGSLSGDSGSISEALGEKLRKVGVNWVYKVRKHMEPLAISPYDEGLLKKRILIESVIGVLKKQTQLEHTRHRSVANFQVHVVFALIAYQLLENKPSLNVSELQQITDLPIPSKP